MGFEYMTVGLSMGDKLAIGLLNALGKERWELVTIVDGNAWLKRSMVL